MRLSILALIAAVLATVQIPLTYAQSDPCADPTIDESGSTKVTISGTTGDDVIKGNDQNNRIFGKGGDDIICAGNGHDYINASSGDDEIYGQAGNDVIYGGDDDDYVEGGTGTDIIFTGFGGDEIYGQEEVDVVYAGIAHMQLVSSRLTPHMVVMATTLFTAKMATTS